MVYHSTSRQSFDSFLKTFILQENKRHVPAGEGATLSVEVLGHRLQVLRQVLQVGDPLSRIDYYREYFEKPGLPLTSSSHMRQLIPLLRRQLQQELISAVGERVFSVIFDGTSYEGEIFAIICRYWDGGFQQKLVQLKHSDKPATAHLLCLILQQALTKRLGGDAMDRVVGFISDSASVNFAAVRQLKDQTSSDAIHLPCWSHILALIGKSLTSSAEKAAKFISCWSSYFSKSVKVLFIMKYMF